MPTRILVIMLTLTVSALAGCEGSEACEKARSSASTKWKAVSDTASKLKLSGGMGWDDLNATQKAKHHDAFAEIERQSQMLFESFAFQKITWNTATPAREKANQAFENYGGKGEYRAFQTTLAAANKQFDQAAAACR